MFDYEAVLPFPFLALLLWPANLSRTTKGLVIVAFAVILIGQFMILTRTFSTSGNRVKYFVVNELALVVSVFAVLGGQYAIANS